MMPDFISGGEPAEIVSEGPPGEEEPGGGEIRADEERRPELPSEVIERQAAASPLEPGGASGITLGDAARPAPEHVQRKHVGSGPARTGTWCDAVRVLEEGLETVSDNP